MVPSRTAAPEFHLPDTDGKFIGLDDFATSPAVLIAFICNHCPYVHHVRSAFAQLAKECQAKGVAVVGICSNDADRYPDDGPAQMAAEKRAAGYTFPYLHDESQAVARAYGAVCTPDFFLFDRERKLVYRGQMDDSRPGNGKPNDGADLRAALDAVLAGRAPSPTQKASVGCSIKWKPGR